MTARALRIALTVAAIYVGAFWLWAGVAKAVAPDAAYDFAARVVGGGLPAKVVVVVSVLAESLLGAALLSRALPRRTLLWASVGLLLVFTGLLMVAKSTGGGHLACGCYAFFATASASVDRELWINVGHAAILGALLTVVTVVSPGRSAAE